MKKFTYELTLQWTGNTGSGTQGYTTYDRSFSAHHQDKPLIPGSSDPAFRGDPKKWNPEELLLSSLSACHMLWYLHLCSEKKIIVTHYQDHPLGIMTLDASGAGAFEKIILRPTIVITTPDKLPLAHSLHDEAHHKCFIARSVNFPTLIEPTITCS